MNVFILTKEYKNSDHVIEIINVYTHYNSAFDAVYEQHNMEFSQVNEATWVTGWTAGKDPVRYLLAEWQVQS